MFYVFVIPIIMVVECMNGLMWFRSFLKCLFNCCLPFLRFHICTIQNYQPEYDSQHSWNFILQLVFRNVFKTYEFFCMF